MGTYKALSNQVYSNGNYALVPIRMRDRYAIMQWRNEQIYHLRQNEPLTQVDQDKYFEEVVAKLFGQKQPQQILFSYLQEGRCIGYGGLVHINWRDKHAEISFLIDTALEEKYFEFHWITYLSLIEEVAFEELALHKIYTYAFDLRFRLYTALSKRDFVKEAQLKEHARFEDKYVDVLIHAKMNPEIFLRIATIEDMDTTFGWANDPAIRAYSYQKSKISKLDHVRWFEKKVHAEDCVYFIMEAKNRGVGSIRFDIEEDQYSAKISYLVDPKFTGKGFGTYLLEKGVSQLRGLRPGIKSVFGYVMKENSASIRIFKKLGYEISFENASELKFKKKIS
ncbi:MAG TPA: GNAT family N-acetyltransferase [Lunatimonas sp.]|nr:GNAT family N-acetyltransferase [Lunatimonas sp.]